MVGLTLPSTKTMISGNRGVKNFDNKSRTILDIKLTKEYSTSPRKKTVVKGTLKLLQ